MTSRGLHGEALVDHLTHFQRRVLIDAMLDGWAATWERAAQRMEWARPRPTDHPGQRTLEEQRAKWLELTEVARACRARAHVAPLDLGVDVDVVLNEAVDETTIFGTESFSSSKVAS